MLKKLLSIVTIIISVTVVFIGFGRSVSAHSEHIFSAFASITPTIDGVISPNEWDDAHTVNFVLKIPFSGVEEHDATLYVKNDGDFLYLAWVIKQEDFDKRCLTTEGCDPIRQPDLATFHFDNDHDGVQEVGDDRLVCFTGSICRDDFLEDPSTRRGQIDVSDGGTADILGASSHTNPFIDEIGDYTFEVRHPLNSNDDDHDFSLAVGDTVGVNFEFFDEGLGSGRFPPTAVASAWADIVIAQQTRPVAIDIKPGVDPNSINLGAAGTIPVAILSSDTFDALTVKEETIFLASARVKVAGVSGPQLCHGEDVNDDSLIDLVCHVETNEFMVEPGADMAELLAQTSDGFRIRGVDSIQIVQD